MPEGPEVKRMAVDLARSIANYEIVDVSVRSGRYSKKPMEGISEFSENLPAKVVGVGAHGKFLYILTSSGHNVWSTLGMTGQWSKNVGKHCRVEFKTSTGKSFFYNDQRNFGTMKFVYGPNTLRSRLEKLGPDMLSQDVSKATFISRLRTKEKWNITKALMDQSIVAGVGNYIKAESLWLAGMNPLKNVSEFTDYDLAVLCTAVQDVMQTSYAHGGATFLTHKNFSGAPGDYSSRFLCYNRKLDAEGNKVIKTKTPDGRTTHWAPDKQK